MSGKYDRACIDAGVHLDDGTWYGEVECRLDVGELAVGIIGDNDDEPTGALIGHTIQIDVQ